VSNPALAAAVLSTPAVSFGDVGRQDSGKRAVVALDAHDPGGGDAQIGGAEVTHADEVRGNECILQGDENAQRSLRAENIMGGK
jgi:hypothetical protein